MKLVSVKNGAVLTDFVMFTADVWKWFRVNILEILLKTMLVCQKSFGLSVWKSSSNCSLYCTFAGGVILTSIWESVFIWPFSPSLFWFAVFLCVFFNKEKVPIPSQYYSCTKNKYHLPIKFVDVEELNSIPSLFWLINDWKHQPFHSKRMCKEDANHDTYHNKQSNNNKCWKIYCTKMTYNNIGW